MPDGRSCLLLTCYPFPMKTGLFLIALGAILTYAVHGGSSHLDLQVVGFIFMIVGAASLVLSFARKKITVRRPLIKHRENEPTEPRDPDDTPPYWQGKEDL